MLKGSMMRSLIAALSVLFCFSQPSWAEFVKLSDDLTMHYEVAGAGKQSVLLVPGWTMSAAVFERQLQRFHDSKDYTVYAIDPRSQGLSTHTAEGNYYEQHGRDLNAFIEKLGLKDIVLGGWSNGGFDVLSYVHQFGSESLKGLVMIDAAPTGSGADNQKEWVWFRKDDSDGFRSYFTQGALIDRQKLNDEFAHYMIEDADPQYLRWISGITNQTGNDVAALLNESSAYQDYAETLRGLEGKVPLFYFIHDEWKPIVSDWAARNTPSATVVALGKHLAFWEHADRFNDELTKFLAHVNGK